MAKPNKEELENLSKKERKDYVRSLSRSQETNEKRTRLIVGGVLVVGLALVVAGIYFLAASRSVSNVPVVGEKVNIMDAPNDRLHIQVGENHVPYSTNPPTSGPHYNQAGLGPIECKVYDKEVLDESAVHNLEHGSVWVTYKDITDKDLASKLTKIVNSYTKTLLSPRAKNDSKIALVSWGWILKLDQFDETKIRNFIKVHKNSSEAPEPTAPCGTTM